MNNQNKITVPSPDMSLNPDLQLFYETAVFVDDEEFSALLRVYARTTIYFYAVCTS